MKIHRAPCFATRKNKHCTFIETGWKDWLVKFCYVPYIQEIKQELALRLWRGEGPCCLFRMMICNNSANNWLCLATLLPGCCSELLLSWNPVKPKMTNDAACWILPAALSQDQVKYLSMIRWTKTSSNNKYLSPIIRVWLENVLLNLNSYELPISKISKWVDGLKFHLWSPCGQCDHQNIFPIIPIFLSRDWSLRVQEPDRSRWPELPIIFANHLSPKLDCGSDK